jgi:hypothetical protein
MHKFNVQSASARNGAFDADERDSDAEILVHDIITAGILTVRGVESEGQGPRKEVMQRFFPLLKNKLGRGSDLSAIKIFALRNDVITPATYVG